ncbi:MAG: cobyric acid synthase [Desulfobacteraceae bacterium]|nr:MAG: cobyric acid synthase [Desulfobacteraceae bacterium]
MNFGHGGNVGLLAARAGLPREEILDFSASINPQGPPGHLRSLVNRSLGEVVHYPDPYASGLAAAIADQHGLSSRQIVVGNGSTEILFALPRVLGVSAALIPVPSYLDYRTAVLREGLDVEEVLLKEADGFAMPWTAVEKKLKGGEMVILGQPNNPTGRLFDNERLADLAVRRPETFFVVDEAFADFVPDYRSMIHYGCVNIVVVRSMTKFYAVPGFRLGYAMADAELADRLRGFLPPWSVGSVAQAVGQGVLEDQTYAGRSRCEAVRRREALSADLSALPGLKVYPGAANYLLVKIEREDVDAVGLEAKLLRQGIAIRVCANFTGLGPEYFRVAVRRTSENRRLVAALSGVLQPSRTAGAARARKTPAIMFLGTSSNAGKSVLAAAMCRILLQDGYTVAPFKAQNMSLNSHVTADGGEMGRAQVVQAQACRRAPDVRMNPVLLKPNSDMGSQVIVMGKPVGNMAVSDYIAYKSKVLETVRTAYDSLAADVDVMVLEGAGSPAEVNLKRHDIVNLAMADYARAAALLVGDIDRGGVFAAFAGTLDLLSEYERSLIAGFVINRFRGKQALLADAIAFTRRHTGLPTFGVVPYVADLGLPEEDSVSFKAGAASQDSGAGRPVEIAVVDLPHISNFTDFDALKIEPDVRIRIVRRVADLGRPAAVILPGSKNVIEDLAHLQRSGLVDAILQLARTSAVELIGICGGFQMLGQHIEDPLAIESLSGRIQGLGLLDAATSLAAEKSLRLVGARHVASGHTVRGYEIHHGQTHSQNHTACVVREDGEAIGIASPDGRIWGTYLHGIFDDDAFRRWFVDRLRSARGFEPVGRIVAPYDVDAALDRLADMVRESLQVQEIYKKAGLR